MQKKLLSLVLAFALCVSLAVPAFAAEISDTAGVNLTAAERRIYSEMEKVVLDIAAGKRTSTEITIKFADRELGWTARELGFTVLDNNNQNTIQAVMAKLNASLQNIYVALEYNHPFELFFTVWGSMRYDFNWWNTGSELWLTDLTISLIVSPDYQWDSDTTVNPYERAKAVAGKEVAQRIVAENAGKSNYEKLSAYRDAICHLTDYDYERLSKFDTDAYIYGRQCQASSVFDGDPNTKTVCEGYSKAFKYLCDISDFDGDVCCYVVDGYIDNGSGNYTDNPHMWNVIRMEDGKYYLTDITLCDTGIYGPNVPLLACRNEDPANYNYQTALYLYRDFTYGQYTDGWLPELSETPYEPGHAVITPTPTPTPAPTPTPTPAPTAFTDVKAGDYYADAVSWALEKNITTGTSATTFSPGETCSRAQILTFLYRASGSPEPAASNPFTDIKPTDYYYKSALWAVEKGMVSGPLFSANTPCTRASTVEYMWKAAGSPAPSAAAGFEDVSATAGYAQAVAWAVENKLTTGTSATTFSPYDTCTRGQIVTFLYRWLAK